MLAPRGPKAIPASVAIRASADQISAGSQEADTEGKQPVTDT